MVGLIGNNGTGTRKAGRRQKPVKARPDASMNAINMLARAGQGLPSLHAPGWQLYKASSRLAQGEPAWPGVSL